MNASIPEKFIPLDKSWTIRMGVLDLFNGYPDISLFLDAQTYLSFDLRALKNAVARWRVDNQIDVGESATLYRALQFASWKLGLGKLFIRRGTLVRRNICSDPHIVYFSQQKLLQLDNDTSQWASAAALLGDGERLHRPPYKLQLTYDAIDYWNECRKNNMPWVPRNDDTIHYQAQAFLGLMHGVEVEFEPRQSEDYCFSRVFGYITKEEGERMWPSLRGHESDRISEMERVLERAKSGKDIMSDDHRVVQAVVMWSAVNGRKVNIVNPGSVYKSWPQFWDFIEWAKNTHEKN